MTKGILNKRSSNIRVGIISYPMLFQRQGGLQTRIMDTVAAMSQFQVEPKILNPVEDSLSDFDIIHIFSVINGNYRLVQEAKSQNRPVVLSPLIQPDTTKYQFLKYKISSFITSFLTKNAINTTYDQVKIALSNSDAIIALSNNEFYIISELYKEKAEKISIIKNGVSKVFLSANPKLFLDSYGITAPFAFVSGTISDYKNQLGVVEATQDDQWPIVLAGRVDNTDYLERCQSLGGGRVNYLGEIEARSPMLASIYANAGVTVLISRGETFGLAAVESLAAGTPVVITKNSGLEIPEKRPCLAYVDPRKSGEVREAIREAIENMPQPEECRALVNGLGWDSIGFQIAEIYKRLL